MAIMRGLREHSIASSTLNQAHGTVAPKNVLPQHLFYIINPSGNYAAYRRRFDPRQRSVPYLLPHIKEGKGKQILSELFQKVPLTTQS